MTIDLQPAISTVEELLAELRSLDGTDTTAPSRTQGRRQHVEVSRRLLYLDHLARKAGVQVMDTYHDHKRREDKIEGGGGE